MIFESVDVRNVRNLQDVSFRLQPSLNLVLGPNGAGKTSFLECIHLLIRGRSFRPGLLNSLISFGTTDFLVTATGTKEKQRFQLGISKSRVENVRMRLNGTDIRQLSQVTALVPTQTFLPDISDLVFGMPTSRRSWLNWSVFHTNERFRDAYSSFLRVLQQRNRAIQAQSADVSVWTEQFVKHSLEVSAMREVHLQGLNLSFQHTLSSVAPDLQITLHYDHGWTEKSLYEGLQKAASRERKYGHTRLGPHRADVVLQVQNSRGAVLGTASKILSRGQGKTVACVMKLAQLEYLRGHGVRCVVLLDDITSELDENYTRRFFEVLNSQGSQLIATMIKYDELVSAGLSSTNTVHRIQLEKGSIVDS